MSRTRRWSDNDHYLGPLTYAHQPKPGYRPFGVVLESGDGAEYPGCQLRMNVLGHTLILALPQAVLRPERKKVYPQSWDAATIERLGRNWYWDYAKRTYGFSYSEGFLQVFLGRQTHDSSTEQRWSKFLPWTQWRHVRCGLYGLNGEHYWTQSSGSVAKLDHHLRQFDEQRAAEEACPSLTFAFTDYDGEALTARTIIKESEWRFGTGSFKWLSLFRRAKIRRSLDIRFSGETGRRKGSWKGGTIGHGIEMRPGELHEAAFRRYCDEYEMRFLGVVK
jgi:hypothetical protein